MRHSNFDIKKLLVDESRDDGPNFNFDNTWQGRAIDEPQNQFSPLWEKSKVMGSPPPSLENTGNYVVKDFMSCLR